MARILTNPILAPEWTDYSGSDGRFDYQTMQAVDNAYYAKCAEACHKNGNHPLLGEILRWQRADGYAEYMVWSTDPLTLIHLPVGDAWTVEAPLIRGLNLADVEDMVARRLTNPV